MNTDLVSYNHAQIRIWVHISLKVKYCHNVFDIREFREACEKQMIEIFNTYHIEYDRIGFDSNHLHTILDLARWKIDNLIKVMKGISGYKLLKQFPEIKTKFFWGSGVEQNMFIVLEETRKQLKDMLQNKNILVFLEDKRVYSNLFVEPSAHATRL